MRGKDRRLLWLVLDGAADRPAAELDGRTPLEAADTPNLDRLAAAGVNGTVDVGPPGTPLSSDRAHAYLFGHAPDELPGRGVLEARGFDLDVPADGVACSASFARMRRGDDGTWIVTDRHLRDVDADYRTVADRLETVAHPDAEVSFTYTWKNRGIVTLAPTDAPLAPAVTDVDPFEVGLPVLEPEPLDRVDGEERDAARRTGRALAAFTRRTVDRLDDVPVDVVLSKWAGAPTDPPSFAERHGLDAASLTPKPVLTGLARTLGMAHVDPPADYRTRADRALAALDDRELVHVHYPEPDEVSHAAGPAEKRDELAAIDATLDPVVDRALSDDELVTVVTADHTTPSTEDVVHSGEPVPVTMTAETVRTDDVAATGERAAATGGLGRVAGRDLLRLSRAAADRVLLDGLRRSPAVRDYPDQSLSPLRDDR
jgi:2,3-bisphosphoglycerate-independent phosphoglycerate mutase